MRRSIVEGVILLSLSRNLAKSGRIAACLVALILVQGAPAGNDSASMPAEAVREAMLLTYIHGVNDALAHQVLGADAVPALLALLREPDFPRRDNVVAFLAFLDDGQATAGLLEFLAQPPRGTTIPEEDRALLLAPQALGHIARRGDPAALDALMSMTGRGSRGGPLAEAANMAPNPGRLQADLMEMAFRGLAFSQDPVAGQRLAELGDGRVTLGIHSRDFPGSARRSLSLYEDLTGPPATPLQTPSDGLDSLISIDFADASGTAAAAPESVELFDPDFDVHDAAISYANHPDTPDPMTDAVLDQAFAEANLKAGRADFAGDIACCVTVTRSGPGGTFGSPGDGKDIIDNSQEQSSVLNDNAARVKVVRTINYCSGPAMNAIGCGYVGLTGIAVVRVSLPLKHEGALWLHEYGHNTGLGHNPDNRHIMYFINSPALNGVSAAECAKYHDPNDGPVSSVGVCSDDDLDEVHDFIDNCLLVANSSQTDTDGDGVGDACDLDSDTDGDGILDDGDLSGTPGDFPCTGGAVANCDDNCPAVPNAGQEDLDGDGVGDSCEPDDDDDGFSNDDETTNCVPASDPLDPASTPLDTDGDLSCDTLDIDDDNDGVADGADNAPLDPTQCEDLDGDTCDDCSIVLPPDTANDGPDADGDGICDAGDTDADNDGYSDADETTNCSPASDPLDPASTPVDTDGDLSCDTLDADDDNDTVLDGDDVDPLDPTRCQDLDGDTCDDCSVVQPPDTSPTTGLDADGDGHPATRAIRTMDGDGYSDADETTNCSPASDPLDPASTPCGHRWRPELRHAGYGRRQRHHPGRR